MYKLSVPINMNTVNEQSLPVYLRQIQECGATRVFLCGVYPSGADENVLDTDPQRLEAAIRYFQQNDLEVGVWVDAFGHGVVLSYETDDGNKYGYTPMAGVMGDTVARAYCPSDEKFTARYCEGMAKIAAMHPDLIMLDDDFRLNLRLYYMGCFCEHHLQDYYRRIGEVIPREQIEEKVFTGGANKYRTAYMQMMRDTLLGFAKRLRDTVDEIDPSIRLGACTIHDNWDYAGTDSLEIARVFAGDTEPFLRTIGAPYWADPLIEVIEDTRLQMAWCKDSGVESFAEGDTYPRPRYQVSSKVLELYDIALLADGNADGILKYMFDYSQKAEYETGYLLRHVRNETLRQKVRDTFAGKEKVGVYSFNAMHKVADWGLAEKPAAYIANKMISSYKSTASRMFAMNSIPTVYEPSDYPVIVFGENAKYIDTALLKNGAIIDVPAAEILMRRGIDVGLLSAKDASVVGEYDIKAEDIIRDTDQMVCKALTCKDGVTVHSYYLPQKTPAFYTYENADGLRFAVMAFDHYASGRNIAFCGNYYRQALLIDALDWVGTKKLPVVCRKNPGLYLLAAEDENELAILLFNISQDEVLDAVLELDAAYAQLEVFGCEAKLCGDTVQLAYLSAYGMALLTCKGRIG